MRTATPCSSRWRCCVTRSTRSASPSRPRSRSSRRWRRRARSPTRSPTPSRPSWPCGWTGLNRSCIGAGRLGITPCPGRQDQGHDLGTDLARLRSEGAARLLCLLTDAELHWAGVPDLGPRARAAGLHLPPCPRPRPGHTRRGRRHRTRAVVSGGNGTRRGSGGDLHERARPERNTCGMLPGRRRAISRSGHRCCPGGARPPRARDHRSGELRGHVRLRRARAPLTGQPMVCWPR